MGAAHFQVLAIGAPCLPGNGHSSGQSLLASVHWPLATSATSSQSSRAHWDQNPYFHRSLNSHLCHHTGQSLQQTLLANLVATDIESTQEHCIVFLLVQTLYLLPSDCCGLKTESNEAWRPRRSGLGRPLWCLAPAPLYFHLHRSCPTSAFCHQLCYRLRSDVGNDEMLDLVRIRGAT